MSDRTRGQRPAPGSILVGIFRLARGRADGLGQFGATREAFLASLAPLIAFPLVGGVLMILGGGGLDILDTSLEVGINKAIVGWSIIRLVQAFFRVVNRLVNITLLSHVILFGFEFGCHGLMLIAGNACSLFQWPLVF